MWIALNIHRDDRRSSICCASCPAVLSINARLAQR
jgi:hypothetical protein